MITVSINVGEPPANLENAGDLMLNAVAGILREHAESIVGLASRYVPVDTGDLLSSITASKVERSPGRVKITVGSNEPYAAYVEFGTGQRGMASWIEYAGKYHWPNIAYTPEWSGMPAGGGRNKHGPYLTRAIEEVTGNHALEADLETAVKMAWEGLSPHGGKHIMPQAGG